jgi:hypothetical protein
MPDQLAPDTFWRVLGSPTGLLPTYISFLYGLNISAGAESAWQTMLGQCANVTRSYSPDLSATCSGYCTSPWSYGLQGDLYHEQTVGWTTIASAGTTYEDGGEWGQSILKSSSYDGMQIPSALYGICDVFGIPLHVYPLPDCESTEWFLSSGQGRGLSVDTCINGFSIATRLRGKTGTTTNKEDTTFVQLSSFNQNGLVPANCPNMITVLGLAWFDYFAMGLYTKQETPVITNRSVYKKPGDYNLLSRWIYFSAEHQSWIVGAEVINGPGLSIAPAVPAEDKLFYPSDTPCPFLGTVLADASKPDWLNTSAPFWAKIASNASLGNVSNATLVLNDPLPDPYPRQAKTCCVPWRAPPEDCEQAVCDCNSLFGLMSVGMITEEQYTCWLGQCSLCTFKTDCTQQRHSDLGRCDGAVQEDDLEDGDKTFTGGCGTMTSAGPLDIVLTGNIDSPVPLSCAEQDEKLPPHDN